MTDLAVFPGDQQSIHRLVKVTRADLLADRGRVKIRNRPVPTAENPVILSPSEVGAFMRCRLKWWWGSQCRLRTKAKSRTRDIGILVHKCKELWYDLPARKRTVEIMERIARKETFKLDTKVLDSKDRNLAIAMATGYAGWALDERNKYNDRRIGLVDITPEWQFNLPLTKDGRVRVRGRLDGLFPSAMRRNMLCGIESKTRSQINLDPVDLSIQLSTYLWAMRQVASRFKRYRMYYQILRRQMPGPRVKAALFHREPVERDEDEIEQWARDTQRVAVDVLDASIYAEPQDNCKWTCDFNVPCLLRGTKYQMLGVLRGDFTNKDDEDAKKREEEKTRKQSAQETKAAFAKLLTATSLPQRGR